MPPKFISFEYYIINLKKFIKTNIMSFHYVNNLVDSELELMKTYKKRNSAAT